MSKFWIRTISILEIIGGSIGILFILYTVIVSGFDVYVLVIAPVAIAIYLLSLVAGIYLWKEKTIGRKLSIITQIIQLPKFISPIIIFMFSFGFDFYPYIASSNVFSNIGIELKFLAFNQLFLAVENAGFGIGVSIPAIIFLKMLYNYNPSKPQIEETKNEMPPPPNEYLDIDGNRI